MLLWSMIFFIYRLVMSWEHDRSFLRSLLLSQRAIVMTLWLLPISLYGLYSLKTDGSIFDMLRLNIRVDGSMISIIIDRISSFPGPISSLTLIYVIWRSLMLICFLWLISMLILYVWSFSRKRFGIWARSWSQGHLGSIWVVVWILKLPSAFSGTQELLNI
jgi:hypothetical protein